MIENQYLKKKYLAKKKKKFYKKKFFWLGLSFIFLFFALFYFFIFSPVFQVRQIELSGVNKDFSAELNRFINESLAKKFLFFRSRSIILFNAGKAKREALGLFPQVADISFRKELPNKLIVKVQPKKAVSIFCLDKNCFLMDSKGFIFRKTSQKNNLIIKSALIKTARLGQQVVTENDMGSIFQIWDSLKKMNIEPKEFFIAPLDWQVKTAGGFEIYFSKNKEINWQFQELKAVLNREIKSLNKLDYIDLRFDKLFYKMKQ